MPTSPSRKLSQRFSRYIGLNERNPWGRRAADMGIQAVKGHAPIAVKSLDFAEQSCPSRTAALAAPLRITVTDVGTVGGTPTLVANAHNGYLNIFTGTTADTGLNLQWNVANTPSSLMQFYSGPNTTISAGRDIYWGIRMAISTVTAWDSKWFVGLAITDTTCMTAGTGAFDGVADAIGFHMGESGVLRLVSASTATGVTPATLTPTSATLAHVGATSATLTASYFHDLFFHAHWATAAASTADSYVEAYFDGAYAGKVSGVSVLPDITSVSLYNTIEAVNGPANDCTLAVAEILNAVPRYHIS